MPAAYRNAFLVGLVVFLSAISLARAADRPFAGRWHERGDASRTIGVIQDGETIAIFGEAGWSMASIKPKTGGLLASGDGKWTFKSDAPPITVNVTIGYRDGRLFLRIAPKDANDPRELKIIMEPVEPMEPSAPARRT
jgi:hypothetical protein